MKYLFSILMLASVVGRANHPTIHVNRLPEGHFADCPNHPDNKKRKGKGKKP
jgi:hypothetical protein